MSNEEVVVFICWSVALIAFAISIILIAIESAANAERIEQTNKKLNKLSKNSRINAIYTDALYEVCTSLIEQNQEQAERIDKLEKKLKKIEKELKK